MVGSGAGLVDAWLARSPDIVWHMLFLRDGPTKKVCPPGTCQKLYLFDDSEGSVVSPDSPRASVAFLEDTFDTARRDERHPFGARDSAVGESQWENSFSGDVS